MTGVHYNRAPIVEAILDVRLDAASAGTTLGDLKALGDEIQDSYPRAIESLNFVGRFTAGDAVGATAHQAPDGYVFRSEDGQRILQARLQGFSFSWLAPYSRWEDFRDEGLRLWRIYSAKISQLEDISRVAVRYVNRFEIPVEGDVISLEDYFSVYPNLPTDGLGAANRFRLQAEILSREIDGAVVINQATLPGSSQGTRSILLDIDAFTPNPSITSELDLRKLLERLRDLKNRSFESCIKDKARRLIE